MYCGECQKRGLTSLITSRGVCPICKHQFSKEQVEAAKDLVGKIKNAPGIEIADDELRKELESFRESLGCRGLIVSGAGGRLNAVALIGAVDDVDDFVFTTIQSLARLPSPGVRQEFANFRRIMAIAPATFEDAGWFTGNLVQAALAMVSVRLGKRPLNKDELGVAVKNIAQAMHKQFENIPKDSEVN